MEATAATTLIAVCCCCRFYCCCCCCCCLFVVAATVDICVGANVANFCLPFAYHKTRNWPPTPRPTLLLLLLQFYVLLAMIIAIVLTMLMFNFGQLAYKFTATWPHVSTAAAAANCSPVYQLSHGLNTTLLWPAFLYE